MERKVNGKIREIGEGEILLELPLPVAEVIENLPQLIGELAQDTRFPKHRQGSPRPAANVTSGLIIHR